MTDADARLKALFAEDEPPARDPVFATAVMQEIARRRFVLDVALLSAGTLLGALVLWALWPVLGPLLKQMSVSLAPLAGCGTLAVAALMLVDRNLGPAFAPKSQVALNHD